MVKKQWNLLSRESTLVWHVRWEWLGNHEANALLTRRSDSNIPALLIIFSLVTTQARLDTCAVQDRSFRDQLSDLRAALVRDHHGIGSEGKSENEWVWWFRLHKTTERILSDFSGGKTQEKVMCAGVSRKEQTKFASNNIRVQSSYLLPVSQKISKQKTPNHYNIAVNKHIKYPGSVKSRSPRKKLHLSFSISVEEDRNSFCPDQWLNNLEKYIWFDTLNSLWGMCH